MKKMGCSTGIHFYKTLPIQHGLFMKHDELALALYRPDIDGLRALAVMAVIGFHAYPQGIPGGFVGVDIFFVISGYLITRLIYTELEMGSFSFKEFYIRRMKRLLPVYFLVSLATLAFSTYLLIPNDFIFFTTSLATSWAFVANVFFSMLSWGYFGQRSEGFPLLHTWSLSVEEQFYFIFPFLLILLFRFYRQALIPICIGAIVVFVALSETSVARVGSYFLLPYRAHELMMGVLVYFTLKVSAPRSRELASALAVLGLILVAGSIFVFERHTPFPGIRSLPPSLGAALLIFAGARENPISTLLSGKRMVLIGLISYSLYLWHWPIFAFLNYRRIDITLAVGLAAVTLAFILSYLSWKFVEQPIRRNKQITFRVAFLRYYCAPALIFLVVGLSSYVTEGAPQRFSADMRQLISSYSFERDLTRSCSIRANDEYALTIPYLEKHCAFGDLSKAHPKVLLMGDSHAHHFKPFVDRLAMQAHLKSVYHVQGSCDAIELSDGAGKEPTSCEKRNQALLDMASKFNYVVLASAWSYKGQEILFEKKMRMTLEKIVNAHSIPVVFKDNPSTEEDLSQCILYKRRGWADLDSNCSLSIDAVEHKHASLNAVIDKLKTQFPQMLVINPKEVMCNAGECLTYIGNVALYKDANHLNTKAAALLAERYLTLRGNPFLPDEVITLKRQESPEEQVNIH